MIQAGAHDEAAAIVHFPAKELASLIYQRCKLIALFQPRKIPVSSIFPALLLPSYPISFSPPQQRRDHRALGAMETLIPEISKLLNDTLSTKQKVIASATESLDRLSSHIPAFPLSLVAIASGGINLGQKIAAATYLKNFNRRQSDRGDSFLNVNHEFRNQLLLALLQAEPAVLKVLIEAFHYVVIANFVKENLWPELVHKLQSIIQCSDLISKDANFQWKTLNALTILQSIIKPFQYFLNPKLAKEPVPPQLELIASEILVPLQHIFHDLLDKVSSIQISMDLEIERILLIICKIIYFAVRSHMPSALVPILSPICCDLVGILDSLNLELTTMEDEYALRLKAGKRSMQIFCTLVTRHRKHFDKLMPNVINCAFKIVKQSAGVSNMTFRSERVLSLSFDFLSHVLETGPGWRFVSPYFSVLLDSAIFPTLVMNQKDILEWEEDADEYIRKNLPSDLEETSGWKDDSFTARKSAINLLGVMSMSKGPPTISDNTSVKRKKGDKNRGKERRAFIGELLVMPFLSKFPIPSNVSITLSSASKNYYGVLMAFGALADFFEEWNPQYTTFLVKSRVLPLYSSCQAQPYLIATANWVFGELASCLAQELSADIYSSLLQALAMPNLEEISCYPVRASAAGAIAELLENDYLPPDWLPLMQVLVSMINGEDENESTLLFQLLGTVVEVGHEKVACHIPVIISTLATAIAKHMPTTGEPWSQVAEKGFTALATLAHTWEASIPDEGEEKETSPEWKSGWAIISETFSGLLQLAWLAPVQFLEGDAFSSFPSTCCVNEASALLGCIMRFITETDTILDLKISELLLAWAELIADWHAWEEMEDLAIFDCIQDAVNLHRKRELNDFFIRRLPSPPAPPVPQRSIIEGITAFVSEAIEAYPSATWRACSCAHVLLNSPMFSFETENIKQFLGITFTQAAFSHYMRIQSKSTTIWKPLLLVISSCYMAYPETVEKILEKNVDKGSTVWARAMVNISASSFEHGVSTDSEIKLAVMTLSKVVERVLESISYVGNEVLQECLMSLLDLAVRLKEVQEVDEDDGTEYNDEGEDDGTDDDDESSEDDYQREETEEEFLERYAKAAADLEDGMVVEESDTEDQMQELELGIFSDVDAQRSVCSLMERYHQVLKHGITLPSEKMARILNAFPEYNIYLSKVAA